MDKCSFFDLLVALNFEYWKEMEVELGVVEVGLGGMLDSTNLLKAKDVELSVVTSIGFDHMHILGHTLEEIAGELLPTIPFYP